MSTEPAFDVADVGRSGDRQKRVSSREVTQSCLDRIRACEPRLNALHRDRSGRGAEGGRCRRCGAGESGAGGALHWRAAGAQGHVLRGGQGRYLRLQNPARFRGLDDLDGVAAPEGCPARFRLGSLQMAEFAYGPTGHKRAFRAVHNPWRFDHITGGSSSGSGAAVAARLTFAALGSDTGGSVRMPAHFCGRDRIEDHGGTHQPCRRHAAVAVARHCRTARAHRGDCALLLGLMAGADPKDPTAVSGPLPDYMAAVQRPVKGLTIGIPAAFYVDDLDPEVAAHRR